jgi:hypothetical protein
MTAVVSLSCSSHLRIVFIPAFSEEPFVLVLVGEGRCIVRAESLAGFGAGLTVDIRATREGSYHDEESLLVVQGKVDLLEGPVQAEVEELGKLHSCRGNLFNRS